MPHYDTEEAVDLIKDHAWFIPKFIIKLVLRYNDSYLKQIGVLDCTDEEIADMWR